MIDHPAEEGFSIDLLDSSPTMPLSCSGSSESRRKFDPALAIRRHREQTDFDTQKDAFMRQLIADFSGKLEPGLRISPEGRINIRTPEGQTRMYSAVLEKILSIEGALQTQTVIRREVQSLFPNVCVPKDWTKALPTWSVRALKQGLNSGRYGAAFTGLKVTQGMSLSSLHRAAKAHVQHMQDGAISFKATITISRDGISIDGLTAKISPTTSGGKTYRYARVNADELAAQFLG